MVDLYTKLKIHKKNSIYASFLFSYPSTYCFKNIKHGNHNFIHNIKGDTLLYIHIPFCFNICKFCNVNKEKLFNYKQIKKYLEILKDEIIFYSKKLKKNKIKGIYIGGGTPTILTVNDLKLLFKLLSNNFNLDKYIHIEIDAHPSTLTKEKLDLFNKIGINQISMGIQSMDVDVLNNISRYGQSKKILDNLSLLLKNYKFHLHFDFIIGLPGEKIDKIEEGIRYISENFKPYSISINGYDNTVDTLLYKDYKGYFDNKEYINKTREYKKYICNLLLENYGIKRKKTFYFDSFYRSNSNVIGIGSGSYGFINGFGVYKNQDYIQYIFNNGWKDKKMINFEKQDYKVLFILNNYNSNTLNEDYANLFGTFLIDDFTEYIDLYINKGLAFLDNKKVIFNFKNKNIATFELIDIYTKNIIKLY